MVKRKAHLVGTWPGRDPEHAMEIALREMAPYLTRMTDGETGDRALWVTPAIEKFRANPDVEMIRDGDWSDSDNIARWKVRDGGKLDPDNIRLHYGLAFENSFPSFKVMRQRYGRDDLKFQVSIPLPLDLAVYAFGEVAFEDAGIVDACIDATARQIEKIFAQGGEEVVFQVETVLTLIAVSEASPERRPAVADAMAKSLLDLVNRSQEGATFGVHLCLGDFHRKAYGGMTTALPLVLLANAIAAGWPEDRTLEYIHAPFAAATEPPIAEEAFYEPLRELDLPDEVRFIAGFQHEKLDLDEHRELLHRIERLTGREVDVAAACGLGRRPGDEAFIQMRQTAALIDTPRSVDRAEDAQ